MYEESFSTPLIVKWPGVIAPGSVNTDLVSNLDFAETILDIARLPIPEDMQGQSMLPLLHSVKTDWRESIYYHYYEYPGVHQVKRHYGIRTDRYKLIHFYHDIDEWELYDLKNDPKELKSVYDDPEYLQIKAEMHKKLEQAMDKYGDGPEQRQAMLVEDGITK
jgi:arylsulfatase A-like enzyme